MSDSDSHLLTFPISESEQVRNGLVSMRDLLNQPEEVLPWIVEGMLPAGGISLLVAKPKVGKSTMARNLALAVARGEPFLGRETVQGTVLYIALEDMKAEVRRHFAQLGAVDDDPIFLHFGSAPGKPVEWLKGLLDSYQPGLAIIDPLFLFILIRDGDSYSEMTRALEPVRNLSRARTTHIHITHHMGKRGGEDGDGVLGSTAIFGAVDTLIEYRKRAAGRSVKSIQRSGTNLEESVVHFDLEAGTVSVTGSYEAGMRDRIGKSVLDSVSKVPMSEADIKGAVHGDNNMIQDVIRCLVQRGDLVKTGSGRKGDPFVYSSTGSL